jgi:2-dehydropantoate 2-reductase
MKIAVVGGAGAMGGVWASRLSAAGQEVTILDVAADALAAIERDGLVVEGPGEERRVTSLLATDDASLAGIQDVAIFFVKAHHTHAAAELARAAIGPETTVVTLQNGWGNADVLAEFFDPTQLVMGVTYHSARVVAPGCIAHTAAAGPTFLGPYQPGASLARAQVVADAMTGAGIATTATADVATEIWKKLVHNSASLPVTALTRLTTDALGADEAALRICDGLAAETVAVGRARGLAIDVDERIATIRAALARGGNGKASMLQDVEARRKTEIEVVNGAIVREAAQYGIDVPLNTMMVALIHGLESGWSR